MSFIHMKLKINVSIPFLLQNDQSAAQKIIAQIKIRTFQNKKE